MTRFTYVVCAAASITTLAVVATGSTTAAASTQSHTLRASTTTSSGWDISWPQCPSHFPRGGGFGVVGVTNGRPWGVNPCLAGEYKWATGRPAAPGLYMNTANPAPHSSYYWPTSGSSDPALCSDATSVGDPGCAYDYGWHAAANALASATSTLTASGFSSTAATTRAWWLDVETGNTWNGTGSANAADLQGSIDYLRSHGVPSVGVYSTSYQWNTITGGYTTTTAASYAASWKPEFTSAYGIAGSPDWVAGLGSLSGAKSNCSRPFTGVKVQLAQYASSGFDADLRCS